MDEFADVVPIVLKTLIFSSLFTLVFSHLGGRNSGSSRSRSQETIRGSWPSYSHPSPPPPPVPRYLAQYRRAKALREATAKQAREIQPIMFMSTFADELLLEVLSYYACPGSSQTFRALLHVSKRIRRMTLEACLPFLPVTLLSRKGVQSFYLFCLTNRSLARRVHHLWVSPLEEEDLFPSCSIIEWCTNVKSLACTAEMLLGSICKEAQLKHEACTYLTILSTRQGWESSLPKKVGGMFLARLTYMNLVVHGFGTGGVVPTRFSYPNLTHLSYPCRSERSLLESLQQIADNAESEGADNSSAAKAKTKKFPRLKMAVVTQGQWTSVVEAKRSKVISYNSAPACDKDRWCEVIWGRSFWKEAEDQLKASRQTDAP